MAITARDPNTILINRTPLAENLCGHLPAIEAIKPGHLLEPHDDSGVAKWGVHDSADAAIYGVIVALDQIELNKGVDDAYAAADLVKAYHCQPGDQILVRVGSGVNTVFGTLLQSNGDGTFKAHGSGVAAVFALETKTPLAEVLVRAEVI